jgi:hypothetical protein
LSVNTFTWVIPAAHVDNKRLNDGVAANVYTIQHQAGCTTNLHISPQLRLGAQWHTADALNNPNLDGDIASDGSISGSPMCTPIRTPLSAARSTVVRMVRDRPHGSRTRCCRRDDAHQLSVDTVAVPPDTFAHVGVEINR